MSNAMTAIMHVAAPSKKPPLEELTPFAAFMNGLLEGQPMPTTTMLGTATWSSFPIEQIVADGIWSVMLKMAEVTGAKVNTELQVATFASFVDRFVNAGLVLAYDRIADAVASFRETVVSPAFTSMRAGELVQKPWVPLATKFFAALVKAARQYGEEMDAQIGRLKKENRFEGSRFLSYVKDSVDAWRVYEGFQMKYSVEVDVRPMVIVSRDDKKQKEIAYWSLRTYREELRRSFVLIRLLKRIPLRGKLPAIKASDASMDYNWIRTQLLLGAGNLPNADVLESGAFPACMDALHGMDMDALVQKTSDRIAHRASSLSQDEAAVLSALLQKEAQSLSKYGSTLTSLISEELCIEITVPINVDKLDAADTLTMMQDPEETLPPSHQARIRLAAFRSLEWEALSLEEFEQIIRNGDINKQEVQKGLRRVPEAIRSKFIEALISCEETPPELIASVVKGHFTPSADLYRKFPQVVDKKALDTYLPEILTDSVGELFRFFAKLPDPMFHLLFTEKKYRLPLFNSFFLEALSINDEAKLIALALRFKTMDWVSFCLAEIIMVRRAEFLAFHVEKELSAPYLTPWDETLDTPGEYGIDWVTRNIGYALPSSDLAMLVRNKTEEGILSWLYEGRRERQKVLREFEAARTAYFEAVAHAHPQA